MIALMESRKSLSDLDWILKITKSTTSLEQLNSSLNCFLLWNKKYSNEFFSQELKSIISSKKAQFWSIFKTKECEFSTSNTFKK